MIVVCVDDVSEFRCQSLPQPINGHMSCLSMHDVAADAAGDGAADNSTYSCRLQCNDGYVPFSAPADVTGHVCSAASNYTWSPAFSDTDGRYLCLRESATL